VAPLTTAILVVGVDAIMGVELEALIGTAAMIDDDETWLDETLLTGAAGVATGTTTKLGDVFGTVELALMTGLTTALLVMADWTELIGETTPLLTEVAALEGVVLITDEAV